MNNNVFEGVREVKSAGKTVWMTKPEIDKVFISKITDYSILILMERILNSVDKEIASEILLSASEQIGKAIYAERIKQPIHNPDDWAKIVNTHIFVPMGTMVEFRKITDNEIVSVINRCPTPTRCEFAPTITCPFSYGFVRGLWKSAFPKGDVFMYKRETSTTCPYETRFVKEENESQRAEMKSIIQQSTLTISKIREYKPMEMFTIKISDIAIISLTENLFKLIKKEEAAEIVMQASEKLGEIVFDDAIEEDTSRWTTHEWVNKTSMKIWNRQGTGIVFSEITSDKIVSHVFKCPTPDRAGRAPHIACPMSWGYGRGIWKKVYPEGELLMLGTMAHGAPTCEFIWYTKSMPKIADLREKTKKYLTREEEIRML